MDTGRLEAFSDGVLAIIITIMVLGLPIPNKASLAELQTVLPGLLSYILSFIYVGIYWNNHHHMFHLVQRVSGGALWGNLHLLFWLSLVPFITGWMGKTNFATIPTVLYGVVLLMAAFAWWILVKVILNKHEQDSLLASAVKGGFKENISMVLYIAAIGLTFLAPWIGGVLYTIVALIWVVPDRRMERALVKERQEEPDSSNEINA